MLNPFKNTVSTENYLLSAKNKVCSQPPGLKTYCFCCIKIPTVVSPSYWMTELCLFPPPLPLSVVFSLRKCVGKGLLRDVILGHDYVRRTSQWVPLEEFS